MRRKLSAKNGAQVKKIIFIIYIFYYITTTTAAMRHMNILLCIIHQHTHAIYVHTFTSVRDHAHMYNFVK